MATKDKPNNKNLRALFSVICPELFKPSFLKNEMRPAIPVDATPTMAYIPLQLDLMSYETDKALNTGTLFPTLDKPFLGRRTK